MGFLFENIPNPMDPHGHLEAGSLKKRQAAQKRAIEKGEPLPVTVSIQPIIEQGSHASDVVASHGIQVAILAKDRFWLGLRPSIHQDAEKIRKKFGGKKKEGAGGIGTELNDAYIWPDVIIKADGRKLWPLREEISTLEAMDTEAAKLVVKPRAYTAAAVLLAGAAVGSALTGIGPLGNVLANNPIYGSTVSPTESAPASSDQAQSMTFAGSIACTGITSVTIAKADAKADHPALAAMQRKKLSPDFNYVEDMPAAMQTKFLADVRSINGDKPIQEDPGTKLNAPEDCKTQ